MRVLVVGAFVAVVIVTSLAIEEHGVSNAEHPCIWPGVWGDANDDGDVSAADALVTLRAAAGLQVHSACGPYDVDCDHDIDATDALKIIRYLAGLKYSQMEPCPDIGTKPGDP
jgi:hypothetical protein